MKIRLNWQEENKNIPVYQKTAYHSELYTMLPELLYVLPLSLQLTVTIESYGEIKNWYTKRFEILKKW